MRGQADLRRESLHPGPVTDSPNFFFVKPDICDRRIRFDDPAIGVDWGEVKQALLSQKDMSSPLLKDSDCNFVYTGDGQ